MWHQARIAVGTVKDAHRWIWPHGLHIRKPEDDPYLFVDDFRKILNTMLLSTDATRFVVRANPEIIEPFVNVAIDTKKPNVYSEPNEEYGSLMRFVNTFNTSPYFKNKKRIGIRLNPKIVYRLPDVTDEVCAVSVGDVDEIVCPQTAGDLKAGQFFPLSHEALCDGALRFVLVPSAREEDPPFLPFDLGANFSIDHDTTMFRRLANLDDGLGSDCCVARCRHEKGIFVPGVSNMMIVGHVRVANE